MTTTIALEIEKVSGPLTTATESAEAAAVALRDAVELCGRLDTKRCPCSRRSRFSGRRSRRGRRPSGCGRTLTRRSKNSSSRSTSAGRSIEMPSATGIRKCHSYACASRTGKKCDCDQGWEASAYDKRSAKNIRRVFPTFDEASAWRIDMRKAVKDRRYQALCGAVTSSDGWPRRSLRRPGIRPLGGLRRELISSRPPVSTCVPLRG